MWILKRKLGDLARGLAGAMPPPLRINLRPLKEEPEWVKTEAARSLESELLSLGFKRAGDFEVEEMVDVSIRAYAGPDQASAAYLFSHPAKPRPVLDLIRLFKDGTSLCTSNGDDERLEQCPEHPNLKLPGASAKALWDELESHSTRQQALPLPAHTLADTYQKGYAKIMDWRVEKGGVSEAELLAQAGDSDEETLAQARLQFRQQHLSELEELLGLRFQEQSKLSIQRWEEIRDRLFFVHDRFTPEELHQIVHEDQIYWLESPVRKPEQGGRDGFKQMLELLGAEVGVEHLETLGGTIPADVYVMPEPPEDDC